MTDLRPAAAYRPQDTTRPLVMVRGGGDLASGVAWRLARCAFPVVILEQAQPSVIRRAVSFASAIYEQQATVEGVTAKRATLEDLSQVLSQGRIAVLVDPEGEARDKLRPSVLVDAILAKRNLGTTIDDAPLVVALGPGFEAGVDCHAVIETMRGHYLGRVYWQGSALPNTGIPGLVAGVTEERVLRAPAEGIFDPLLKIGDPVEEGQVVARVDGQEVVAGIGGALRGLLRGGLRVRVGMKVGDVDPRGELAHCFTVSDKALAVAGGVLEAIVTQQSVI